MIIAEYGCPGVFPSSGFRNAYLLSRASNLRFHVSSLPSGFKFPVSIFARSSSLKFHVSGFPRISDPHRALEMHRRVAQSKFVKSLNREIGATLPEPAKPVELSDALKKLTAFAQSRDMTIEYSQAIGPKKGTSYRGRIRLLANMEPAEKFPVLLREVVSQVLYSTPRPTFVTRAIHQQETQAAAFVVCEALALECKTEFSGCQLYYGDSRLLAESLQLVHKTAALVIHAIRPEGSAKFAQEVQQ